MNHSPKQPEPLEIRADKLERTVEVVRTDGEELDMDRAFMYADDQLNVGRSNRWTFLEYQRLDWDRALVTFWRRVP